MKFSFFSTFCFFLAFVYCEIGHARNIGCSEKKVFSGRFFGVAKKIALFQKENKNFNQYLNAKNIIFDAHYYQLKNICRQHQLLIDEAKKRSISYPQITQNDFFKLHLDKMNTILMKHIKGTKSYQAAISSVVTQLKKLDYPHRAEDSDDEIYLDFSKTIENQIIEELRIEQIEAIESLLFGGFDQLIEMNTINMEVKRIKEKIQNPIFSDGKSFEEFIKTYSLENYLLSTSKASQNYENLSISLQKEYLSIAESNLKKSMQLYIQFVLKLKNPAEKIQQLENKKEIRFKEILEELYQSKIENEDEKLSFLNLNFNNLPINSIESLKQFPASFRYLKINCPHIYQAINIKLETILSNILKLPYFSTITASWKPIPPNQIYLKALDAAKSKKFETERKKFYERF